jgi:cobyrinic acid a,c-diamide synthase
MTQLDTLIDRLAQLGDSCFDWERLLPLLREEGREGAGERGSRREGEQGRILYQTFNQTDKAITPSPPHPPTFSPIPNGKIRVAVARDRAFSFYYQDNLDILQKLGAELVFWSPLTDAALPEGVQGLYLGGGFPEVFAQQLAENTSARDTVRKAVLTGMPTYAECGGLMYLCEQITNFEGQSWSMVGVLPTTTVMCKRLTVGYRQATALQDSPLLPTGATVWGHEFHHSQLTATPDKPLFETRGYDGRGRDQAATEGWRMHQLHASYVHLHWGARPEIPAQFLQRCYAWEA